MCRREQPHTPLDSKIHLKLIPSNWFGCLQKSRNLHWITIRLNSRSPYLLLVVSSPIFSSLLFSSSHALSACREIFAFPPRLSLFVCLPLSPLMHLLHRCPSRKGFFLSPSLRCSSSALKHPSTPPRLRSRF